MEPKCVKYQFECQYCDPVIEKYVAATEQAMERHYLIMHNIEDFSETFSEKRATKGQIFEKFPLKERLKLEQVCKKWHRVGKNHSWSNFRSFNNNEYAYCRVLMMKPFFDRCGPYLRHLTLDGCPAETAITVLRMAPNVQHLSLFNVEMNDESLKKLAQTMPDLKSLSFCRTFTSSKEGYDYNMGLVECFKTLTRLEYLHMSATFDQSISLFDKYSFVQFPPNLKHLSLSDINNVDKILSWVCEECKDLKGLRLGCRMFETTFMAISKLKSLTHLAMRLSPSYGNIDYVFEALTELQALEINGLDETAIIGITRYCKKLEHLSARDDYEIIPVDHANILRLASLPNLCSLVIYVDYAEEQTTELVNRLIAKGNLQVIKMITSDKPVELLYEILRQCKVYTLIVLLTTKSKFSVI
ncbi:hypothetical protein Ddc_16695 [Ditylenchus destructor]|nr:hypothetical protein Ddc_16695 [Ditylenchus destructor]